MNEQINIKELISRYIDQEVTAEEKEIVEQALKNDPSLYTYYQEQKKLSNVLDEWTVDGPSPDWEQKVQRHLLADRRKESESMKSNLTRSFVGIASVVVLVLSVYSLQIYVKRGIQGRIKAATDDIGAQYSRGQKTELAKAQQYEPYYLDSSYTVVRDEASTVSAAQKIDPSVMFSMVAGKETLRMDGMGVQSSAVRSAVFQLAHPMIVASQPVYDDESWRYNPNFHTEEYSRIYENEFMTVKENPVSTFSIDVDTASYSNVRRFLNEGQLPPEDAVRIEEMVNYFSYDYPQPTGDAPFSITTKGAVCPWNAKHSLVSIGLQGKILDAAKLPPSNLVFLVDVSGSMDEVNKLPLLQASLKMLVNELTANERVAIVVYAGAAGQVLESTPGNNKQKILSAIDSLHAGGSTAGSAGINLAYEIAKTNFIAGGNNRVILATDGDFNVGVSSDGDLVRIIEEKRKDGIFLTILGFGMGNYKDSKMEQLADKGNGGYYYIDTVQEAKKVLVSELGSTLFTIAKDVKIQIEFNPAKIKAYRLIGYENRLLAKEDFNDDTKDAGELGAGHTVTALYEIVTADSTEDFRKSDDLVYQQNQVVKSDDAMTVKLRYKDPDGDKSKRLTQILGAGQLTGQADENFQFAAAVAEFGLILRNSQFKAEASYDHVITSATSAKGKDAFGYRDEFVELVKKAKSLDQRLNLVNPTGINFKGATK